jgi:hypothetical protein
MTPVHRAEMPTAGRLAGGIMLALVGWYMAGLAAPLFNEGRPPSSLLPAAILTGLYVGWSFIGGRIGAGYILGIGLGLTAAVAFAFLNLFVLGFSEMIARAMRMRYDGPMDAFVNIFALMLSEGERFLTLEFLGALALGAILSAWVAEFFGRRYS